jgi:hypothetical protein
VLSVCTYQRLEPPPGSLPDHRKFDIKLVSRFYAIVCELPMLSSQFSLEIFPFFSLLRALATYAREQRYPFSGSIVVMRGVGALPFVTEARPTPRHPEVSGGCRGNACKICQVASHRGYSVFVLLDWICGARMLQDLIRTGAREPSPSVISRNMVQAAGVSSITGTTLTLPNGGGTS